MKQIPLTKGKIALVDDKDFEFLNQFRWQCSTKGYAERSTKGKIIKMHRLIMDFPREVDHKDGNKLNNQKSNLRIVSRSQNRMNCGLRSDNSSGYKGASFDKPTGKWVTQIQVVGKRVAICGFKTVRHAALAYDLWAKDIYGEFAKTNFEVVGFGKH